ALKSISIELLEIFFGGPTLGSYPTIGVHPTLSTRRCWTMHQSSWMFQHSQGSFTPSMCRFHSTAASRTVEASNPSARKACQFPWPALCIASVFDGYSSTEMIDRD